MLRGAAGVIEGHPSAEGAEGVRQGLARPGRVRRPSQLTLDRRAFAYWDPAAAIGEGRGGDWQVTPGTYELHVGRSSADVAHVVSVER